MDEMTNKKFIKFPIIKRGPFIGRHKGYAVSFWFELENGSRYEFLRLEDSDNPALLKEKEAMLTPGIVYRQVSPSPQAN